MTTVTAAAIGCGPTSNLETFEIQLSFSDSASFGCPSTACADYGLACGGVLHLRVVEAEPDASGSDVVLDSYCVSFSGDNLCALDDIGLSLRSVPAKMLRLQVAIWSQADAATGNCPTPRFDAANRPINFAPTPAFGGQIWFPAGELPVAEIPLSCPNPEQLDDAECQVPPAVTRVSAGVTDLDLGVFVPPAPAANLRVSVGEPIQRLGPTGPQWLLEPSRSFNLPQSVEAPVPLWGADVAAEFQQTACLQVLEEAQPGAITTIKCDRLAAPNSPVFSSTGFFLGKANVDAMLAAAAISPFPLSGVLIGRVVDHLGEPAAGAIVAPDFGSVAYLSADRTTTVGQTTTSSNGYFISTDVPFDTRWQAVAIDGRKENAEYRGGLVVGKIAMVRIVLEPPKMN